MRNLRYSFTCFYGILCEFEKKAHIYTFTNLKVSLKPIFLKCTHMHAPTHALTVVVVSLIRELLIISSCILIYKTPLNSALSYGTLFSFI